jgi:hypothetical protein
MSYTFNMFGTQAKADKSDKAKAIASKAFSLFTKATIATGEASVTPIKAAGFIAGSIVKLAKEGYDQASK